MFKNLKIGVRLGLGFGVEALCDAKFGDDGRLQAGHQAFVHTCPNPT